MEQTNSDQGQRLDRMGLGLYVITCLFSSVLPCLGRSALGETPRASDDRLPNVIYVMCDDLGYGDIRCLAPRTSRIPTPNADQLAAEGIVFTDAHSGSSVCTPTRYGLLTGRYSWRTRLQKGVVTGFAPCLIEAKRPTVASFLRSAGYDTAIIGKWHLDFMYLNPADGKPYKQQSHNTPPVGAAIPDGPVHRGFDYFHGFHHARNMEAVIENDRVIQHDEVINMLPRLTRKSVEYLDNRKNNPKPFFLYVPLGSPHTPIVPSPEWQGKSGLGSYGDFVMQTDNVLGEINAALKRIGQFDNTILIFTSDNGCSKAANIKNLAEQGHRVSGDLRGSKADLWDGGHRLPFIVRWPGTIQAGAESDQLICHTDLFATLATLTNKTLPTGAAEDSVCFMPALVGKKIVSSRNGVVHHSISGHFAYRHGQWKLLLARGSGGWTSPKENQVSKESPEVQLYDMSADRGENHNLSETHPEIVQQLLAMLRQDVEQGRSTHGPKAENDFDRIELWKSRTSGSSKRKGPPAKRKKGLGEVTPAKRS